MTLIHTELLLDEYKRLVVEAGFKDVSDKVKESESSCTSSQTEGPQTTSPIVSVSVVITGTPLTGGTVTGRGAP